MIVMRWAGVTIVSITSRSISVNDRPNCSQNQAGPLGPAGCPAAGSWSVKSALYLSSTGTDASRIRANASRVAWPPSAISVATGCPPVRAATHSHLLSTPPYPRVQHRLAPARWRCRQRHLADRPQAGRGERQVVTLVGGIGMVAVVS